MLWPKSSGRLNLKERGLEYYRLRCPNCEVRITITVGEATTAIGASHVTGRRFRCDTCNSLFSFVRTPWPIPFLTRVYLSGLFMVGAALLFAVAILFSWKTDALSTLIFTRTSELSGIVAVIGLLIIWSNRASEIEL